MGLICNASFPSLLTTIYSLLYSVEDKLKVLVVMPTYNERENLAEISKEVLSASDVFDLLVVDDASPDGTGELADKLAEEAGGRIKVIHRQGKLGLGSAYVAGFKYALENNYDVVFEMDADFSHNPCYLVPMLKMTQQADMVIGSRYVKGVNVVNWPMRRLLLSYFANLYTRIVTGLPLKDATTGFTAIKQGVLRAIALDDIRSDGYSFQIELKFRAYKKGFRLREVPIVFVERAKGKSKMSSEIVREAIVMVWQLRIMSLLGKL